MGRFDYRLLFFLLSTPNVLIPPPTPSTITTTQQISQDGPRCIRREEAEEEVVQGQGYVHTFIGFNGCESRVLADDDDDDASMSSPHQAHTTLSSRTLSWVQNLRTLDANSGSTSTVKDKAQHAVILDKNTSEKLYKDVQSYRLVTVATLVDRLKINGSLARKCLKDLEEKGQIKAVVTHSKMRIYSTCSPLQANQQTLS